MCLIGALTFFCDGSLSAFLSLVQSNNLERAVDWIFSHPDELAEPGPAAAAPTAGTGSGAESGVPAGMTDGEGRKCPSFKYGILDLGVVEINTFHLLLLCVCGAWLSENSPCLFYSCSMIDTTTRMCASSRLQEHSLFFSLWRVSRNCTMHPTVVVLTMMLF